jgi:hypothetical protein
MSMRSYPDRYITLLGIYQAQRLLMFIQISWLVFGLVVVDQDTTVRTEEYSKVLVTRPLGNTAKLRYLCICSNDRRRIHTMPGVVNPRQQFPVHLFGERD